MRPVEMTFIILSFRLSDRRERTEKSMQYFLFEISQLRLSPTLEMTTEGKVSVRFGRKERKATEWRLFAFKRNCANYKSFSALPLIPPLSKGRLYRGRDLSALVAAYCRSFLIFAEGTGGYGEGVGYAVARVFVRQFCHRFERGERAVFIPAVHRVCAGREGLSSPSAVGRVARIFAVYHV